MKIDWKELNRITKTKYFLGIVSALILAATQVITGFVSSNYHDLKTTYELKYDLAINPSSSISLQRETIDARINSATTTLATLNHDSEEVKTFLADLDKIISTREEIDNQVLEGNLSQAESLSSQAAKDVALLTNELDVFMATKGVFSFSVTLENYIIGGKFSDGIELQPTYGQTTITVYFSSGDVPPISGKQKYLGSISIEPEDSSLLSPAKGIVYYEPNQVPRGWNESDLQLVQYNWSTGTWKTLGGIVDTNLHRIIASIDSFGSFAVIANAPHQPPRNPMLLIVIIDFLGIAFILWLYFYKTIKFHTSDK